MYNNFKLNKLKSNGKIEDFKNFKVTKFINIYFNLKILEK